MTKKLGKKRHFNSFKNRWVLSTLAVLVIAIIAFFALHHPKKTITIPSTSPVTNQPAKTSGNNQSSASSSQPISSPSSKSQSSSSAPSSTTSLLTPYGDFVSNHHPGSSNPTSEASVCHTTAGATCYIQFTKGDLTRKLDVQTTDSSGATYWYWDVKTAGLDSGSWTITAIASLNGETKTATDAQPLVVQ